jgi:hypothetical protein
MSSDPAGNKGPNTGPAGMTGTTTVQGKTVKQYGTKKDAEQTRLENFQQGTINRTKDFIKESPVIGVKLLSPIAVYGADVNSKFFTDKVLTSSKAKKNIGYTQSQFAALTADQQNKVFSKYMSERQTGVRDAYGNLMPGVRIENIAHKKADGTMTTRQVIMRDNSNGQQKTESQIEAENVAAQKAAQAEADQAAVEQADAYKKKRLSITSSRSLFGKPGGRGFFD